MITALCNGRVLIDGQWQEGRVVLLDSRRIADIVGPGDVPAGARRIDLAGDMLAPGFVDTQVNGGGGVLFNDAPTVDGIAQIGRAHRRFGTTGFLPTLISADLPAIDAAMRAVDDAIAAGVPGVLGIHIEGPFLSEARRGIHDSANFRPLDEEALALLTRPFRGRVIVTLAPETTGPAPIRALAAAGVTVSIGHSEASYDEARQGFAAGATGVTHLFNAMSPFVSRAPGVVGAALENASAWCGIIVDGAHVHPAALRVALQARPVSRFMLVTDAMSTIGTPATHFSLQGRTIRIEGDCGYDANGTLAGTALTMVKAVRNAMAMLDLDFATAVAMAATAPAAFLGMAGERGRIASGLAADLLRLTDDLEIRESWIGGAAMSEEEARLANG